MLRVKIEIKVWWDLISECNGSYGENCKHPCSSHCVNKTCEWFNGNCVYGCTEGQNCDQSMVFP